MSFLSLVINGPTSGPLLRCLGLVTPTETRTKVITQYVRQMQQSTLIAYFELLDCKRFQDVEFAVVKEHVSALRNVTKQELDASIVKYRRLMGKTPNLSSISSYISLPKNDEGSKISTLRGSTKPTSVSAASRATHYDFSVLVDKKRVAEQRKIFINLLRQEYHHQVRIGELDSRGFIPYCLFQSLDKADEAAAQGQPLNDWVASQMTAIGFAKKADWALHAYRVGGLWNRGKDDEDFQFIRSSVINALCFINAHLSAQEKFKAEFASLNEHLSLDEKTVIDESRDQISRADSAINAFDTEDVKVIKSQHVCQILLHKSANYFEKLAVNGLMTEREAEDFTKKYDSEIRELRVLSEQRCNIRKRSYTRRAAARIAPENELGRISEIQ